MLEKTADGIGVAGRDIRSGFGRVDTSAAVSAAAAPASIGC